MSWLDPFLAGKNAYTRTLAPFTQPNVSANVTIVVAAAGWMVVGQPLWIGTGGAYTVVTVVDATHVTIANAGSGANASPGATIPSGSGVSPNGAVGPQGPPGAGERVAPDANDVIVWTFDEANSPYANSGSGANEALTRGFIGSDGGRPGWNGVFDNAWDIGASGGGGEGAFLKSAYPTAINYHSLFTTVITVSFWIYLRSYNQQPSNTAHWLTKPYRQGSYAPPYTSIGIGQQAAGGGVWSIGVTTNVTQGGVSPAGFGITIGNPSDGGFPDDGQDIVALHRWNHVGLTLSGSTLKGYLNGNFIRSKTTDGNPIDWNSGTNGGPWFSGCNPDNSGLEVAYNGTIDDVRIANVARDLDWFRQVFRNGLGIGYP